MIALLDGLAYSVGQPSMARQDRFWGGRLEFTDEGDMKMLQ